MSSTILYKFRSGTTYEALPLPGSSARLFDVKKAIVIAKKLDAGTMEFDLSVRNASTNEEYNDESMILPRGTRLIVQRLPAAKGQGFLTRMARNQYGMPGGQVSGPTPNSGSAPSGFYTIDSRVNEDDEEFISSAGGANDEDKELAALKAVTETANASATTSMMRPNTSNFGRSGGPAGQGPPQHHGGGAQGQQRVPKQRQNADPELRRLEEQEKQKMGRRKATGIPRTFLNVNLNPENKEGEGEGENNAPLLQPNTLGFEELKNRGGGQSENTNSKKSLDYALKVTATTIPDYLQCALCHSVALTAMFLTWDPEGRTTCDKCIRDALTQNGFRDPLTGMEGISPDDLRPNPGIRKAAEAFVKEVMDKIEEIEKQQVDEEPTEEGANTSKSSNLVDGDSGGVVVTKRNSITKRKAKEEEDPFGGDDDFGGDVFAVAADEKPEEEDDVGGGDGAAATKDAKMDEEKTSEGASPQKAEQTKDNETNADANNTIPDAKEDSPQVDKKIEQKEDLPAPSKPDRRGESRQRRGPPAGYQMGPAGGATSAAVAVPQASGTRDRTGSDDYSTNSSQGGGRGGRGRGHHSPGGRGGRGRNDRGGFRGGRGGRGRGFRGGRFQDQQGRGDWDNHSSSRDDEYASRSLPRDDFSNGGDNDGRSSKRPRHDSSEYESGNRKQDWDDRSGGDYGSGGGGGGYHGSQGGYNQGAGYHAQTWQGGRGGWEQQGAGRGSWDQNAGHGAWDQSAGRGGWEERRGVRGGGRDFGQRGRGAPPSYGGRGRGGWDRGGPGGGGGRGHDGGHGFRGGGGRRGFRGGRGRRGRY